MPNLAELLTYQLRVRPSSAFVRWQGSGGMCAATYAEVAAQAEGIARQLLALGIGGGARVALLCRAPNIYVPASFAVWSLGAVVVPLHWEASAAELTTCFERSRPSLLITDADGAARAPAGVTTLHLARPPAGNAGALQPAPLPHDTTAEIMFTSGSRAEPKGVMLSHESLWLNASESADTLALRSADVQYCAVALTHAYGQNRGMLSSAFAGASVFAELDAAADARLAHIAALKPSVLLSVPSLFSTLLAVRPELASVRVALSGAAPLAPAVQQRFQQTFSIPLLVAYGMTECSPVITSQRVDLPNTPGGVGYPLRGVELKIVDDSGQPSSATATGHVLVRGHNVMQGYLGDAVDHVDAEGWFRTGDLGRLTGEGELVLDGRANDFIKRAGYKVFPAELQDVLRQHPAVVDVLVAKVRSPLSGEDLSAFVRVSPDALVTTSDLAAFCAERLPAYKLPGRWQLVDKVPQLPSGKPGLSHDSSID